MKLVKKVLAGVAVAAAMASAQASPINVAGILWDPTSGFDFTLGGVFNQAFNNPLAPVGSVLSGFGSVAAINGVNNFCTLGPNCTLTFVFDNYALATGTGSSFPKTFTGGTIKLYVDNDGVHNSMATSSNGVLWANLVANEAFGFSLSVSQNFTNAQGTGFLDVIGGAAAGNLDTDVFGPTFGNADLSFGTTVSLLNNPGGNGTFTLNGNSIPEPASLALVGLGLLGLAASRRRKSV